MFVIMGDAHVPGRAARIPEELLAKVKGMKPHTVLWTGDFTDRRTFETVNSIAELKAVKGNMDMLDFPFYHIIELKGRKLLLIHGDVVRPRGNREGLIQLCRKYGCSIIVCGHTHIQDFFEDKGVFLINPGSCTGSGSGAGIKLEPSFASLDEENLKVTLYRLSGSNWEEKQFSLEKQHL